jgi:hypothetical protein
VGRYAADPPHGIDAAGIARACAQLAALIEADGTALVTAPAARVRLTTQ